MAKKIAVYVDQVSEDEFVVMTNGDQPGKSVTDHCSLVCQTVRPDWRTGIAKWLTDHGYRIHPDSDYVPDPFPSLEDCF